MLLAECTRLGNIAAMSRDLLPSYLRLWRARSGLTQEAVAAHLGIARNQVTAWETGGKRIPLERLFDLADLYGITTGQLLSHPDDAAFLSLDTDGTDVTREELLGVARAYLAARKKST